MADMPDESTRIANKVRGLASEHRCSQERVGEILGLSRQAVNVRFNGRVPFTATELYTLACEWNTPIQRFYPEIRIVRMPEALAS